jgi:hypothetical protein
MAMLKKGVRPVHASPDDDFASYAEAAYGARVDFMLMLVELNQQLILGALAGMYHQWDKELRTFIIRELNHTCDDEFLKSLWKSNGAWAPVLGSSDCFPETVGKV